MDGFFNFRQVCHAVGIPPSNENHWSVGQQLVSVAAKRGIEPLRILTEKTDPNPSVAAPHAIAHYPLGLFPLACDHVRDWWGNRERQLSLV
jgi:hypothetical protein